MIRAIETHWKGYRFRSRLEARWAVFFDALKIRFEYEPEGFDLGRLGPYLPDFFLPEVNGGVWLEIKPNRNDADDLAIQKISKLAHVTKSPAMIMKGAPHEVVGVEPSYVPGAYDWSGAEMHWPEGADCPYLFCVCPWTKKIGIQFDGRSARICGWEGTCKNEKEAFEVAKKHMGDRSDRVWRVDDKIYNYDDPILISAAMKAKAARFEHGEVPA